MEDFIENGEGTSDENALIENANEEIVWCKEQFNESLMLLIGMEFNFIEETYYFYNTYAKVKGFEIRKSMSYYDRKTNKLFVCEKDGMKRTNDPR